MHGHIPSSSAVSKEEIQSHRTGAKKSLNQAWKEMSTAKQQHVEGQSVC